MKQVFIATLVGYLSLFANTLLAQDGPVIIHIDPSLYPAPTDELASLCFTQPDSMERSATCPALQWNGHTYLAYSYNDARPALNIVAYDMNNNVVRQWEKTGARHLWRITADPTYHMVTFWGQEHNHISLPWETLALGTQAGIINTLPLYQTDPNPQGVQGIITLPQLRLEGEEIAMFGGKIRLDLLDGKSGTCQIIDSLGMPRSTIPTADADFDADIAAKLDRVFAEVRARIHDNQIPGAVMQVDIGDKSWRAVAGQSRISNGKPRVFSDYFRIGSVSKVYTATALLLLVQEGLLSLDDSMEKWFADETWYSSMPHGDKITVRQLLRHQSGLPEYYPAIEAALFKDPLKVYTPETLLGFSLAQETDYEPSDTAEPQYANTNFILAGLLIEKVTGVAAEKIIRDKILKPLNLFDTMSGTDPSMPYYYAHGYHMDVETKQWQDTSYVDPSVAWTSGAMISNIDNLITGFKCQVSRSADCPTALLSEQSLAERLDYAVVNLDGFEVGYGFGVFNVCNFVYKIGGIQGYDTAVFYHPNIPNYGEVSIAMSINMFPIPIAYDTAATVMRVIGTLFPEQCAPPAE